MWGWIAGLLRRLIHERGRFVFRYWDGRRYRLADPFVAYRRLATSDKFDWESDPIMAESEFDDVAAESVEKIAAGVREAFGVPAFDDGGLTDLECYHLLHEFVAYTNSQKKRRSTSQTSQARTDSPPSDRSPTPSDTGSGSTPSDSSTVSAGPSPQGSSGDSGQSRPTDGKQ